ncbi:MAG TPA: TonB-dependent receptor, partial [Saprospiraceae bacterium]|nr:TonB-dependent receptor [Saprospiraceae bacterium]
GASALLPDYRLYNPNFFTLITKKLNPKTQLDIGARYEYHRYFVDRWINREINQYQNNFHSINANIGIGSKVSKALKFKADLSYVSRPPQINELYSRGIHQGLAAYEEGNANLTNENSLKAVVDMSLHLHEYGHLSIAAFIHHIDNFIYMLPRQEPILTIRGAFFAFDYQNSNTWLRGIDAIYKVNFTHSTEFLVSGAITRSINRETKEEILWTPPPTFRSQITHDFYINKSKSQEVNFSFGVDHVFENKFVSSSDDLLPPPPYFTLFNASLTFKQSIAKKPIQMTISSRNLLNNTYRNYLNRFRYFADEPGRSIDLTLLYNF